MDGLYTGIRPVHIYPTSKMVSDYSGMMVQPHKAIVGANAFAHESGIHQDGMLKHRETYEIMTPETIGLQRNPDDAGKQGKAKGKEVGIDKVGGGAAAGGIGGGVTRGKKRPREGMVGCRGRRRGPRGTTGREGWGIDILGQAARGLG